MVSINLSCIMYKSSTTSGTQAHIVGVEPHSEG